MSLERTHFFIHPSGGVAPRSAVITALPPGPRTGSHAHLPQGGLSWPPQLEVILPLPLNSCWICRPFNSDRILHLLPGIFSHLFTYVKSVFNKPVIGLFENRKMTILSSFPGHHAFMGWWEAGKEPTRSSPPALISLQPRAPEGRATRFHFLGEWAYFPGDSGKMHEVDLHLQMSVSRLTGWNPESKL